MAKKRTLIDKNETKEAIKRRRDRSAKALTQPIRWFIQTLYENGYEIIKRR